MQSKKEPSLMTKEDWDKYKVEDGFFRMMIGHTEYMVTSYFNPKGESSLKDTFKNLIQMEINQKAL